MIKKLLPYSLMAVLILAAILSGCGGDNSSSGSGYSGVAFKMDPVPAINSFPIGLNDILGGGPVTIPYYICGFRDGDDEDLAFRICGFRDADDPAV